MVAPLDSELSPIVPDGFVLKYRGVIQEIGPMVDEFLPHGVLIFFGTNAPPELREVSLVHDGTHLHARLAVGDVLLFSPPTHEEPHPLALRFYVTAVGEMADTNLSQLGHLVIHFDSASTANLPGTISVDPALQTVPLVGTTFDIFGLEKH